MTHIRDYIVSGRILIFNGTIPYMEAALKGPAGNL